MATWQRQSFWRRTSSASATWWRTKIPVRKAAWHVVEPATAFVPGWDIDAIVEHLEAVTDGLIRNLVINVPPRRWLFSSYGAQLSMRDSVKCRRLIESPWYQAHWRAAFTLAGDQNSKARFENDRTGYRLSTSVGGAATGEGGDRVVRDDPHNVQEAESDTVRKATLDWWNTVMSTRLNNPRTAAKVIVMQRCHQRDLSGHVLEQGGWEHLCLPAEYEGSRRATSINWTDPRTELGELLWEERFGPEELTTLKRSLGSYAAAGQLQQRPSPVEGGILKKNWWKHYRTAPEAFEQVIQSWDCAFKDTASSDYVVGQVWGRVGADGYLLDQVRARMDCPATTRAVKALSEKWPAATAKLVEDKANGPAVIQMLQHEVEGLIPVNPEGGKEARARCQPVD